MRRSLLGLVIGLLLVPMVLLAGEDEIIKYVQNYNGLMGNIRLCLAITSMDYNVKMLGWEVKPLGKSSKVRFWFTIDGEKDYAEWLYGAGTKRVEPLNEWAYTFMGK